MSVGPRYSLTLYVAGTSGASARAISRTKAVCEEHLAGRYELEVVDLYLASGRASADDIVAAPTLVISAPPPPRRIIGALTDEKRIRVFLEFSDAQGGAPDG